MYDKLRNSDPAKISSKTLAYIGDSVFELYSRLYVLGKHDDMMSGLHKYNIEIVNAGAQARSARKILELLTDKEMQIFKRGRNINSGTMAKNANAADYRVATGLEALIGYLYLAKEDARLGEILDEIFKVISEPVIGAEEDDK